MASPDHQLHSYPYPFTLIRWSCNLIQVTPMNVYSQTKITHGCPIQERGRDDTSSRHHRLLNKKPRARFRTLPSFHQSLLHPGSNTGYCYHSWLLGGNDTAEATTLCHRTWRNPVGTSCQFTFITLEGASKATGGGGCPVTNSLSQL